MSGRYRDVPLFHSARCRQRRHGRAMHRAMRKHNYRVWVQGGRKIRRGMGEISVSRRVFEDAFAVRGLNLLNGGTPPPLTYVHPRAP